MSKLHEISCRDCGSSISLNEEWDRTPYDMRPQDRVLRRCLMCGGEMLFYKRWIDTPTTHPQCSDGRWADEPCTMCFGPMTVGPEAGNVRNFHDRCHGDYWYEKACDVCHEPLKVHVDWEDPPSRHRSCEVEQWYEKGCKYCGSTLKVHVSWEHPPAAHRECEPVQIPDYTGADIDIQAAAESDGDISAVELIPYQASDRRSASNGASASDEPAKADGSFSNSYEPCQNDVPVTDAGYDMIIPSLDSSFESIAEAFVENGYQADHFEPPVSAFEEEGMDAAGEDSTREVADEALAANCYEASHLDLSMSTFENDAVEASEDTAVDTVDGSSYESFDEPTVPDFLVAEQPAFAASVDDLTDVSNNGSSDHESYCTRCGKQLGRTDAFHISNGGDRNEEEGLCRGCEHDIMLVNGAIAALRNKMNLELNVASELRTVTRPVTVVTNAETGEVIAEVMLVDTGIFSAERAAVAYDPLTDERFSKTVFGHKGLFSTLRTAETYDRDGHLLHHARHGELALAADATDSDDRTTQVSQNRFFFRKR